MQREDVIQLAREAGFSQEHTNLFMCTKEDIAQFANVIEQRTLERAAQVCDGVYHQHIGPQHGEVRYGIAACAAAIRALKDGT